jgi:hypothetical protein
MKKLDCHVVFEAVKSMLRQNENSEVKESFAAFD